MVEENQTKGFEFKTKEIEIEGEKYTIKEFSFDEYNRIEASKIALQWLGGDKFNPKLTPDLAKVMTIKCGLSKAPFVIQDDIIKHGIPARVMQKLYEAINELNGVTEKKSTG